MPHTAPAEKAGHRDLSIQLCQGVACSLHVAGIALMISPLGWPPGGLGGWPPGGLGGAFYSTSLLGLSTLTPPLPITQ